MSQVNYPEPRTLQWVPMSRGAYPEWSIEAGIDTGKKLYVARATHQSGLVPGKLHVGHSDVYIAFDGKEVNKSEYEVCNFLH